MMRTFWGSVTAASVLAFSFFGCNAILDNEPGVLGDLAEAGALPEPVPTPTPDAPDVGSPDAATPDPDAGDKPSVDCPAGQRRCDGVCVSLTDPVYGCGDPSCAPCASSHSAMGCQGRTCVVAKCDPGFSDCNATAADGCETDLSQATSCGTCNASCAVANPLCAPAGPSFQCTNGCTPVAPLNCGNECVDPNTSVNHCGGCNVKCPVVTNGTAACAAGACSYTCKPAFNACNGKCVTKTDPMACGADCVVCPVPAGGAATCTNGVCGTSCTAPSHVCGGKCVSNDPTACGAACTACPAPPNAAPTCAAETCGFACTAGFGNCDANAVNGCETTFATDPLHCGQCGKTCNGQACVNGVCQVAPPPPPP